MVRGTGPGDLVVHASTSPPSSSRGRWTPCSPCRRGWTTTRSCSTRRRADVDGVVLRGPRGVPDHSGQPQLPVTATIAWLNRYVKRDTSVDTGPGFEFVDQNGTSYSAPRYPRARPAPRSPPAGTAPSPWWPPVGPGPSPRPRPTRSWAAWSAPITPAPATNAVDVPVTFGTGPA